MAATLEQLTEVEGHLNKLQQKFNVLCLWVQLKFDDAPAFPSTFLVPQAEWSEVRGYSEKIIAKPRLVLPSGQTWEIDEVDRIRKTTIEEQTALNTTPCFVKVPRLELAVTEKEINENAANDLTMRELLPGETDEDKGCSGPEWRPEDNSDSSSSTDKQLRVQNYEPAANKHVGRKSFPKLDRPLCGRVYSGTSIPLHVKSLQKEKVKPETLAIINQDIKNPKLIHFCLHCEKGFSNQQKLQRHARTFHPDVDTADKAVTNFVNKESETEVPDTRKVDRKGNPTITCPCCNKSYSRRSISVHIRTMHKDKCSLTTQNGISQQHFKLSYPCVECEEVFHRSSKLKKHIKTTHLALYARNVESGEFTLEDEGDGDKKSENVKDKFPTHYIPCPCCQKCFTRRSIFNHIRYKHKDQLTAEIYDSIRNSIENADKTVNSNSLFTCPVCNDQFKLSRFFRTHVRTGHIGAYSSETLWDSEFVNSCLQPLNGNTENGEADQLLTCPDCGKVLMNSNELDGHLLAVHNTGGSLNCSQCEYQTKYRRRLESHILIHSDLKKFKCSLCPYEAKQPDGLRKHIFRAHEPSKRQGQCTICGKLFKNRWGMKKHIEQVHENLRRFPCHLCPKAFKNKTHLQYHVKTHGSLTGRKRGLNKGRDLPEPRAKSIETDAPEQLIEPKTSTDLGIQK